jgi:hypothetical protein
LAQAVESLIKCEALRSNPSPTGKKKKEVSKGREGMNNNIKCKLILTFTELTENLRS